jgi:FKBP-type peptidyl-prolyl cis-trans isomerase FklB
MKKHLIPALVLALSATALAAADKPDLTDSKKRVSYAIGLDIGSSFKQGQIEVDPALLAAGIADALAGNPALSEAEMRQTLQAFQQEMQAKAMARQQEEGSNNLKTGETFLAANGKKEGVKTTASGLQYKSLKAGAGKSPKATDTVKVHYTGTLIDGTVFDSSVKRGEPVEFSVDGVIPGWTEALQLMKVGDKWQLFIPSKLAYGERGTPGGPIGPNSTLIFEVELLAIAN